MYLFDTDVLSNMMKRSPSSSLQNRISTTPQTAQFTSSVTLGELVFGASKKGSVPLRQQIERLVLANIPVLPFDRYAAVRYGEIRADLERQGRVIGDADIRIAAIALVHGLIVVTGNIRHFAQVSGLPVENWL